MTTYPNTINNVLKAFCEAQKEFQTLPKDKAGYGYKYTDLDTVIQSVRPILSRHGLGFTQMLNGGELETLIIHGESGEYFGSSVQLPDIAMAKTNAAQNLGAAITYMKRYALCAILGISSDEDVDGVQKAPVQKTQEQSPAKQNKKPQETQQPAQVQLAGGNDTPQECEMIKSLLNATRIDGEPVFNPDMGNIVLEWRKSRTAKQVIDYLTAQVNLAVNGSEELF